MTTLLVVVGGHLHAHSNHGFIQDFFGGVEKGFWYNRHAFLPLQIVTLEPALE